MIKIFHNKTILKLISLKLHLLPFKGNEIACLFAVILIQLPPLPLTRNFKIQ